MDKRQTLDLEKKFSLVQNTYNYSSSKEWELLIHKDYGVSHTPSIP